MRAMLIVYLGAYFVVVIAAAMTLWQSGLIDHLHPGWTAGVVLAALLLGVGLAIVSRT